MALGAVVYTLPGSPLHCELCEAFLSRGGYIVIEMDQLYQVVSMVLAADGERILWRLDAAEHAGRA